MTRDQQRLADYLTHIQVAIERIGQGKGREKGPGSNCRKN
jgi:hypothetical protein